MLGLSWVNSCAAGASVPSMPRRPTAMPRAHDVLLAAAAVHARIAEGTPHPSETGEAPAAVTEPTTAQKRARSQKRNEEGKFA